MIRLAIRVPRASAELVLAELLELAPSGVEEREDGDVIEYAVYGAPGELPALPAIEAASHGQLVEVRSEEVADDWADRWRAFHRPVLIGERLWVRPPWSAPSAEPGVLDLVIDPGQAFGTGAHPTTRLCLELLLGLEPGGPLVDLGCGSGVLSIAAAKLGWEPVTALDFAPECVAATQANATANGVALATRRSDVRREPPPAAPLVVANLLRPLLLEIAGSMPAQARTLVLSGLLRGEADEIGAAYARHGFAERERREQGDWAALALVRG